MCSQHHLEKENSQHHLEKAKQPKWPGVSAKAFPTKASHLLLDADWMLLFQFDQSAQSQSCVHVDVLSAMANILQPRLIAASLSWGVQILQSIDVSPHGFCPMALQQEGM